MNSFLHDSDSKNQLNLIKSYYDCFEDEETEFDLLEIIKKVSAIQ